MNNITLDFSVDYTRTVAEMVKAGKYDRSNRDINSESYPVPKDKVGKKEKISTRIFQFGRSLKSEEVIEEMSKEGYRPATAHEIMAFAEKNPELQRQLSIVALGSVWGRIPFLEMPYSLNSVLVIDGGISRRRLDLSDWSDGWIGNYGFLGVHK